VGPLGGRKSKDKPLMGLRPVVVGLRTLVRT
jgi:hypothetical protein